MDTANTAIKNTEVQLNRKNRQKKLQKFDVLVLKRSGAPRSFTINSGKVKFLLFLLCLLIINVPVSIYLLHYQYNRIAVLSSEIERFSANIKYSADINSTNEISKKSVVTQPSENNLKTPATAFYPRAASDKQSVETDIGTSTVTNNISNHNKSSDTSENIKETSNKTVAQAVPPISPSDNIAEVSSPSQEAADIPSQNQTAEIEQYQDQESLAENIQEQPDRSEYSVIVENIYHELTQNKLDISFDIVNKSREQKNGHVCMIIYSNEKDKASYIVHPERVEIDNNGDPLFHKRGIPFSIYSFRHIKADIPIVFTEPFFIKFLVYDNNGDITYDKIINITS